MKRAKKVNYTGAARAVNFIFGRVRRRIGAGIRGVAAAAALSCAAAAADSAAVATIAPLHSLLQNIIGDGGEARLLVAPGESPHHARMSPSQARLLQNAAAVFYIDESFEHFLARALRSSPAARARVTEGMSLLRYADKEDGDDEHREHEEHREHDDHDEHNGHDAHDDRDEHDEHDDHDTHDGHEEHDEHAAGETDWHVWLDVERARQIARRMAQELAAIYPQREAQYAANLRRLEERLDDLDLRLQKMLAPARARSFMTTHDAYQYFVRRYKLSDAGALRGGHAEALSAKRLRTARRRLARGDIVCVFAEPQLPARQLESLTEDTNVKTGVLDPLGADLTPGASLYFDLMLQMGRAFAECLSPPDADKI